MQTQLKIGSQEERLLKYLNSGRKIDRLISFQELGIIELSARIVKLQSQGHKIVKDWKTITNRFGEKVKVRTYSVITLKN